MTLGIQNKGPVRVENVTGYSDINLGPPKQYTINTKVKAQITIIPRKHKESYMSKTWH